MPKMSGDPANATKRHKRRSRFEDNHRPKLNASTSDLLEVTMDAWQAILSTNDPPTLFRHNGDLVRLETGDQGEPVAQALTEPRMTYALGEKIEWFKTREGEVYPARPPGDVAANMLATPDNRLPILDDIHTVPVYAFDGTLQDEPGYYPTTRSMYIPPPDLTLPPIPLQPSDADIIEARSLIMDDLLGDFPFTGATEKAHALAACLQPFVRKLIEGPTPLYMIEKPTPGTGGTLLAQILCYPALGYWMTTMTVPRDEGEWRRTITATLRDAPAVVFLDNVDGELKSPTLASVITSDSHRDRAVRTSATVTLKVRCMWIASGNNPSVSKEIARRTIRIRLDARLEHPDQGRQFRHPDLRDWVARNRASLIWAALTLVQAWIAKGRPPSSKRLGMFESWSETMGGILEVANVSGLLESVDAHRTEMDDRTVSIKSFIHAWFAQFESRSVSVAELSSLAANLDFLEGDEKSRNIRLGLLLRERRDQCFDGLQVKRGKVLKGIQQWRVLQQGEREVLDREVVT